MATKKIDLKNFSPDLVRNFSIIAHIDHGKSTLSDRLLEDTGTITNREKKEQFLDKLQVERERGITVKAQSASMFYEYQGKTYLLNLIDTPGHVDFSYEVSRSLYACQGALLLVDAAQGVQAQTMANFYLAFDQDLSIIPVLNKIDLPNADPDRISHQLESLFDFKKSEIIAASAKANIGMTDILNAIIERIPAPKGSINLPLKALLFDSWFDEYRGVICLIAVQDGIIKKGDLINLARSETTYEVLEIGIMYPEPTPLEALYPGQVGYLITGMKTVREARVGDTIYHHKKPVTPFPGFKPAKPMVFAGIYPVISDEFTELSEAIEKLTLNDASVTTEKKTSAALGLGFRCGFLGLLHMDVFKQRLEQEYNLSVIATAPSVLYKIKLAHTGEILNIESPADFPESNKIEEILEPIINATIITPTKYLGNLIKLCEEKRGIQKDMRYMDEERVILKYRLPLNEVATDFYDELKSLSSGYASFDYEEAGYEPADLVKMDILLNSKVVDALSCIVHRDKAYYIGRELTARLKKAIPRQLYEVIIQAALGAKVLARDRVAPLRKDVTAKCYGGDITRKRKLLEKQKEGKKKMKQVGNVEVPQEAFLSILKK
ncbi:MAG TPA: translation elongation factor 4 [Candidatus Dependentiae bacterium]|nr:translation elongation factor 4 [Candidatus Dependentiae bacterium]HRQ62557.1 translation elongation factor 4 [Candidatus Dependentiae bacterium]